MLSETWEKTEERKRTVCAECKYHMLLSGYIVCDYIEITHKKRPCPGHLCVEQGVFKPIPKRKSKYHSWKVPEKAETTVVKAEKKDAPMTKSQLQYQARKEKARQYYLAHKEEMIAKSRAYKQAHPEKVAEFNANRRRARQAKKGGGSC